MSAEELEERIAKISTDIELQKAVLRKLEHSKILVQRQLNSVRDPVARLPLEISSEIFIQCLPPLPVPPGARHVPMLLLNICNAWSDIALSTPALWAGIRLRFPYTEGFREFVGTWLGRARNHPLSVSLSSSFRRGVDPVIWQYGQQLKHLEVCYEKEDDEDSDTDSDILGFTSPVPLPLLETLTIRGSLESPPYRIFRIVKLLHLTPNLVECVFNCTRLVDSVDDIHPTLVLPNLRQLMVGNADSPHSDDGILKHLTLPQLESLSVGMYEVSVGDILSFLERSSSPLRKLVMGDAFDDLNLLDDCLRRVPTLMCLGLWWPESHTLEHLFAALAESPSHLLPNLRSLTLTLYLYAPTIDSCLESLLRALTTRRSNIKTVRVEFWRLSSKPEANILAAFKKLEEDGMEVYIGTESQNFCSV